MKRISRPLILLPILCLPLVGYSAPSTQTDVDDSDFVGRRCLLPEDDGSFWIGRKPVVLTAEDCLLSDGALVNEREPSTLDGVARLSAAPSVPPPTISVPAGVVPQSYLDILARTGIQDRAYRGIGEDPGQVDGHYDCDDFAGDLTSHLDSIDANLGTYTIQVCYDSDNFTVGAPYDYAHAITDVHIGDQVFWIEPQSMTNVIADGNRDGSVTFYTSWDRSAPPSEGRCSLIVYPDRAAAEADYGPSDTFF